ncbi:MAG: proline--tRNA ligase, partial [Chlamydiales bacterium]
ELDFVIVDAHSGKIGGSGKSEEFQVKTDIGEDVVMTVGDYAANVEATQSIPPSFTYSADLLPMQQVETPGIASIEDLSMFMKVPPQQILKTIIYKLIYKDKVNFFAIGVRGDRQVNPLKLQEQFEALEIAMASDEEIAEVVGSTAGFIGPLDLKIPFYADHTCEPMTNFVCAGNIVDIHFKNVNWVQDVKKPKFADFLRAEEGDACPHIDKGVYKMQRGTEVGHIFNLGTKYSEKLQALYQDEAGSMHPFWMGTYGIGVGRTAQACVEQKHDERGIIWPFAIAPFKILITSSATNKPELVLEADKIYEELAAFEPLYDDRDQRLGFKLKDSDLIGIPYKLIVGKSWTEKNQLEIESRTGEKFLIERARLLTWAKKHLE